VCACLCVLCVYILVLVFCGILWFLCIKIGFLLDRGEEATWFAPFLHFFVTIFLAALSHYTCMIINSILELYNKKHFCIL